MSLRDKINKLYRDFKCLCKRVANLEENPGGGGSNENIYNTSSSLTANRVLTGDGRTLLFQMDNDILEFREAWELDEKVITITNTNTGQVSTLSQSNGSIFTKVEDPGVISATTFNTVNSLQNVVNEASSGNLGILNIFPNAVQNRVTDGATGNQGEMILSPDNWSISTSIRKSSWSLGNVLSANVNDWNPTDYSRSATIEMLPSASVDITGLNSIGTAQGTELLLLNNSDTFSVTLKNEDAGSLDNNRFRLPNQQDVVIPPYGGVVIVHGDPSTSSNKWYIKNISSGGGITPATEEIKTSSITSNANGPTINMADAEKYFDYEFEYINNTNPVTFNFIGLTNTTIKSGTITFFNNTGNTIDINFGGGPTFSFGNNVPEVVESGETLVLHFSTVAGNNSKINITRIGEGKESANIVILEGTTPTGPTFTVTGIPATNQGKTLAFMVAQQSRNGVSYSTGNSFGADTLEISYNYPNNSVSFLNRTGDYATAQPYKIILTYL